MGDLCKVWVEIPEGVTAVELKAVFHRHFGAAWEAVLNSADGSFAYNAQNTAYFAVTNLRPSEPLNLERLPRDKGTGKPPNVVVS